VFQLRREYAGFPESLRQVRTEEAVREILRDYNRRALTEMRRPTFGKNSPPIAPRADVEALVDQWHRLRAAGEDAAARGGASGPEPPSPEESLPSPRRRWWRRRRCR